MEVKSIGALSLGKVAGVVYAALGLIFGLIFAFFAVVFSLVPLLANSGSPEASGFLVGGLFFAVLYVVILPILYGVFGFLLGLISALLYNLVARLIGGVEIELEQRPRPDAAPSTSP